jgi:predicted DNA-binding protein
MAKAQDAFIGLRINREFKMRLELLETETGEKPSKVIRLLLEDFLKDYRSNIRVATKLGLTKPTA